MEELDLRELLKGLIDWNHLEDVVRDQLEESIDYEDIASEIIGNFDITEAVIGMIIPF